jgi:hypothetical protein
MRKTNHKNKSYACPEHNRMDRKSQIENHFLGPPIKARDIREKVPDTFNFPL